jgi:ferredoxin
VQRLLPAIHEVDRQATRIWFSFFPLALARAFEQADDAEALADQLLMKGRYRLHDQIDSSHRFLFGHRYWRAVKEAVAEFATADSAPRSLDLDAQIRDVARQVASKTGVDTALLVGITAVAFMTLQQVGIDAFKTAPGELHISKKAARKTPEEVLRERAKDRGQGLFGFLKGVRKVFHVTFDENDENARFKIINDQEITSAAAEDKHDYHAKDPRCITGEGPIPIECRAAACGTCWVGILGGNDNVTEVGPREYNQMRHFGYTDSEEGRPLIRLACTTRATGPVSIVIPPWNGVFGRYLQRMQDSGLGMQDSVEKLFDNPDA